MTTDLVSRAQIILLARTLHVEVEELQHLERLGAEHLNALREQISNVIFDDHAAIFKRVSALVPIVPLPIAMPIVQKMVPPMMAGRAAGAIGLAHPNKAAQALTLVKVPYAAEAAPYMDPRAVVQLATVAPPGPVVDIANELLARRDYATAGLFVDAATPELIKAVEAGVPDDEGLLRSGAYVLSGKTLSNIMRVMLDAESPRISGMIATAVNGDTDLRLAALSVLSRCDEDVITRGGDILFDETDSATLADMLREFVREGAGPELLHLSGHLSPSALDLVAANPATEDLDLIGELVKAAADSGEPQKWRGLLDILERTNDTVQQNVIGLVADLDHARLVALAHAATKEHLWPVVLRVLAKQDPDDQTRLTTALRPALDAKDQATLERHIHDLHLDDALKSVTSVLATVVG